MGNFAVLIETLRGGGPGSGVPAGVPLGVARGGGPGSFLTWASVSTNSTPIVGYRNELVKGVGSRIDPHPCTM